MCVCVCRKELLLSTQRSLQRFPRQSKSMRHSVVSNTVLCVCVCDVLCMSCRAKLAWLRMGLYQRKNKLFNDAIKRYNIVNRVHMS